MARPVERWLETFMCGQYADIFHSHGYRTLQSVCQLDPHHLRVMGVLPEHCDKIMENVSVLRQSYMAKSQGAPSTPIDPVVNPASSALATVARNASRGGMPGYSEGSGGGYMNSGQMAPVNYPHQQNTQMGMPPSMQQYPGGPGFYGSGPGQGQGSMYMQQQQHQPGQYGRPGHPYMNQMGPGGMQMPQGYSPPGYGPGGMPQNYPNALYGPATSQHGSMGGMNNAGPGGNPMYAGSHNVTSGHNTVSQSSVGHMGNQAGCIPGQGQQGMPAQQNMPPQQNMPTPPDMQNQQGMPGQQNMPEQQNMASQPDMASQQGMGSGPDMSGGGQMGMSAGNPMMHHHTRSQLLSQSPQQVADNILQMASHQYTANGPVPPQHMNKYGPLPPGQMGPGQMGPGQMGPGQMGPGQMGPGPMGHGQMGPGAMGPGQMPQSPHMMQNSPSQYSGVRTQGNQFMYPNASPVHPQNRMSPVSPMQVRSPASAHSNPPSMPSTSPGPMQSPIPLPERSPANASIPSPSMTTLRSPSGSMQAMHSPMNCHQPMRSPMHSLGPTPSPHMSVGSQQSPAGMGGMPMRSPSHPGPQGPGPGPGCGPGPGPGPGPGGLGGPSPGSGHFSPNSSHPAMNCSSGHSSPSGYSTCSQPSGPPQPTSNNSMYLEHSTSSGPTYSSPSISDSANPLQSLQKLVMLPESQVVDPKSVVNDACLPSTDGSKNCDGPKNYEGCELTDKAEPVCSQPRCLDGKHCGSDVEAQDDGAPKKEHEDNRTNVKAQAETSADAVSTTPLKPSKKEKKSKNAKKNKAAVDIENRITENGECDDSSQKAESDHNVSPRRGRRRSGPANGPVNPVEEDPGKVLDIATDDVKLKSAKKGKSKKKDLTVGGDVQKVENEDVISPTRKRRGPQVENGPSVPKKGKQLRSSPIKAYMEETDLSGGTSDGSFSLSPRKRTSAHVESLMDSLSPVKGLQRSISPKRGRSNGVDPVVDLGRRAVSPARAQKVLPEYETELTGREISCTEKTDEKGVSVRGRSSQKTVSNKHEPEESLHRKGADKTPGKEKAVSPRGRSSLRSTSSNKHQADVVSLRDENKMANVEKVTNLTEKHCPTSVSSSTNEQEDIHVRTLRRTRNSSREPKDADVSTSKSPLKKRTRSQSGDTSDSGIKKTSPKSASAHLEKTHEHKMKPSNLVSPDSEKVGKDNFRDPLTGNNLNVSGSNKSTPERPKQTSPPDIGCKRTSGLDIGAKLTSTLEMGTPLTSPPDIGAKRISTLDVGAKHNAQKQSPPVVCVTELGLKPAAFVPELDHKPVVCMPVLGRKPAACVPQLGRKPGACVPELPAEIEKEFLQPKENQLRISPRADKSAQQKSPAGKPKRRRRFPMRPNFVDYDTDSSTDEDYVLPTRWSKASPVDSGAGRFRKKFGKDEWQPEKEQDTAWHEQPLSPKFGKRKLGEEYDSSAHLLEKLRVPPTSVGVSLVGQLPGDESDDTLPSHGAVLVPPAAQAGTLLIPTADVPTASESERTPDIHTSSLGLIHESQVDSGENNTAKSLPTKLGFPERVPSACIGDSLHGTPDKKKRGRPHSTKNKGKRSRGKLREDEPMSDTELQVLKLKKTLDTMHSGKKKLDKLNTVYQGPIVRVTGRKDHPVSCLVVNVRDNEHEKMNKKKKSYSSDGRHEKTTALTSYTFLDSVPWMCAFCGNGSNYKTLGDLFGPYHPDVSMPSSPIKVKSPTVPSMEVDHSSSSQPELLGRRRKKRPCEQVYEESTEVRAPSVRRSSTCSKDNVKVGVFSADELPAEIWVHEDCVVWSHGVYLLGNKLHGLEEAISVAKQTVCSACRLPGATLGCFLKGCPLSYHYMCAVEKDCHLDEDNFSLICPKHKDKKMKVKMVNVLSSQT